MDVVCELEAATACGAIPPQVSNEPPVAWVDVGVVEFESETIKEYEGGRVVVGEQIRRVDRAVVETLIIPQPSGDILVKSGFRMGRRIYFA